MPKLHHFAFLNVSLMVHTVLTMIYDDKTLKKKVEATFHREMLLWTCWLGVASITSRTYVAKIENGL